MKDLSYLEAFDQKALRSARRILEAGFIAEDINKFLSQPEGVKGDLAKMPVSKKYEIFKEKNPDSDMTIEEFIKELRAGRVPCRSCKDEKKLQKEI